MPRAYFDEDEGPGEHDAHLLDDGPLAENDVVPCPACGKSILAAADRCYRCGEHFGREAWLVERSSKRALWVVAAALVIAAMLWFLLG